MGCDIHLYIEKKVRGEWICISPMVMNKYSDPLPYSRRKYQEIYDSRNYSLFAFLANVRGENPNGFGEPRGLPLDVSKDVNDMAEEWGMDGHSHSWVSLKEIKENMVDDFVFDFQEVIDFCEQYTWNYELGEHKEDEVRIVFWFDN